MTRPNIGSTLRISLTDAFKTKTYYEETLTVGKDSFETIKELDTAIKNFESGAYDAIEDIHRDIDARKKLGKFSDAELSTALQARGYRVFKE
jgi:hypothetical protein